MPFPLKVIPKNSWKEGGRQFGANRDGGKRLHAGCDLLAPVGTPIYPVAEGRITLFKEFYLGTWYMVVDHDDFIVRYGEIQSRLPPGISVGMKVMPNMIIGHIGHLKGLKTSMLHFEMYTGDATGPLTCKANGRYQRRSDLMDPTAYLDAWAIDRKPLVYDFGRCLLV